MRTILSGFLRGLIIVGPLGITLYVVYAAVTYIDGLLKLPIPGAGIVLTVAMITLVGWLASNVLGTKFVEWMERGIARLPIVKLLYASIKDLLGAFIDNRRRFSRPVMIDFWPHELPKPQNGGRVAMEEHEGTHSPGIKLLGFVTRSELPIDQLNGHVAVYVPQCYNLGGMLLMVPKERIQALDADSAQTMAFIVSGGLSGLRPDGAVTGSHPIPNIEGAGPSVGKA